MHKQSGGRSYRGSRCQVCDWEMRSNVTKNVAFCSEHSIQMWNVNHPLPANSPFAAARMDLRNQKVWKNGTAWSNQPATWCQKGHHDFYIPLGVWGKEPRLRAALTPQVVPGQSLLQLVLLPSYKKRLDWLVAEGLLESASKARGRKRKKQHGSRVLEFCTSEGNRESDDEPVNVDDLISKSFLKPKMQWRLNKFDLACITIIPLTVGRLLVGPWNYS